MELQIVDPSSPLSWPCLIANEYRSAKVKVVEGQRSTDCASSYTGTYHVQPILTNSAEDKTAVLFTTNSIAFELGSDTLRQDKCRFLQAQVLNWMDFGKSEVYPMVEAWLYPHLGLMPAHKANIDTAKAQLKKFVESINRHLAPRTFLVGERLTLADITVYSYLADAASLLLDKQFLKPYVHFNRWLNTVANQANVKKVVGTFKPCGTMPKDLADGEKGHLKRIFVQSVAPQTSTKKATTDSNGVEAAEKEKDPFAALPKGTFNMDEFKRVYSNNDTATVAIPFFWDKFDSTNYSIWHCVYRFPEELQLTFMTANLVSGMFQRLDKMRKHAFASMCIFGDDNKNQISGIWIWRGHGLAFELCPDWTIDYESYTWTKLDPVKDKKMIDGYLLWECEHEGLKFNEGKIFK